MTMAVTMPAAKAMAWHRLNGQGFGQDQSHGKSNGYVHGHGQDMAFATALAMRSAMGMAVEPWHWP